MQDQDGDKFTSSADWGLSARKTDPSDQPLHHALPMFLGSMVQSIPFVTK
jgi:hypothetical protein